MNNNMIDLVDKQRSNIRLGYIAKLNYNSLFTAERQNRDANAVKVHPCIIF